MKLKKKFDNIEGDKNTLAVDDEKFKNGKKYVRNNRYLYIFEALFALKFRNKCLIYVDIKGRCEIYVKKMISISLVICFSFSCFLGNIIKAEAYDNSKQEHITTEAVVYLDEENYLIATTDPKGEVCYINPRGATDEYYYLQSTRTYGSEFVLQVEKYSNYYNAGIAIASLATATKISWGPFTSYTVLKASFEIVKGFVPSVSRSYDTVVTHYAVYGEAVYRVEVAGEFRRYATYSNLKVPTRKVYNYS